MGNGPSIQIENDLRKETETEKNQEIDDEAKSDEGQEAENDENQQNIETLKVPHQIKVARLYSFLFLARRFIMVLIVVLIPSSKSMFPLKILLLIILQTDYIAYTSFVRSFEKTKDQVVEVLNEIVYFVLILFLIKFDSEPKWTSFTVYLYIGIIFTQLLILSLTSITGGIIGLVRLAKRSITNRGINIAEECENVNESVKENNDHSSLSICTQFNQHRLEASKGPTSSPENSKDHQNLFEEEKNARNGM